uniref:Ubiquitin-like domain-containing protein n=1 Tax=Neogobius melanostomus TaxID=47308 RepID=A0A8C6USE7_9GOBI
MKLLWVCYNQGAPVAVEIEDEASVSDLKREVGGRLGVESERLRVLFAGRELRSVDTLRSCDLPEQSTVHVVLPRADPRPLDQADLDPDHSVSLTRVELSPPEERSPERSRRRRSSFFVFCKSCGGVREGKLRVRCKTCQQSTLTLDQGPSCWDDVQSPGRIHGVCHSDGCDGGDAVRNLLVFNFSHQSKELNYVLLIVSRVVCSIYSARTVLEYFN